MAVVDRVRNLVNKDRNASPGNDELERLANELRVVHRQKGEPSCRALAARTGLSAATISRIFNATKPPKWSNLQRVLDALDVAPAQQAAAWYPLWSAAQERIKPLGEAAGALDERGMPPDPQKTVCGSCGVEVKAAFVDVHATWHKALAERLRRLDELLNAMEHRTRRLPQAFQEEATATRRAAAGRRAQGGDRS